MRNQARFAQRSWLALAGLLLCAGITLAPARTVLSQAAQSDHLIGAPMVIQGRVIEVQKDSITIRTPNIRPTPEPGKMTPMYIIAGETFKANISHAEFDTPIGMPNARNDLKVGDAVVVLCPGISMATGANIPWPITAEVVEKIIIPAVQ